MQSDIDRTQGMALNGKRGDFGQMFEDFFFFSTECDEMLKQTAQRYCECPIPGGTERQMAQGPEQSDLVSGNTVHGRVGTR